MHALELVEPDRELGHRVVRVEVGVTVAREVLDARRGTGRSDASERRDRVPGDELGRLAERAHPDHRVARVGVDIGDGPEHDVRPDRERDPGELAAHGLGRCEVVDDPELRRARQRRPGGGLDPGDVAALLVDAHHERPTVPSELGGQRHPLAFVAQVVGEQHDAGEARVEFFAEPSGTRRPRKPGQSTPLTSARSARSSEEPMISP